MERYRHGAGVVTYVARYLRGGPIKNAAMQSGRPSISIHGMFASPSGATAIGTATAPPPPATLCQQLVPTLPKRPGTSLSCNTASLCLDLQGLQIGMLSLPSSGSQLAAGKAAQLALWRGWGWLPVARGGAGGVLGGSGGWA